MKTGDSRATADGRIERGVTAVPESATLHPLPLRGYHEEAKHTKDAKKRSDVMAS